jgi:hypothetical protein
MEAAARRHLSSEEGSPMACIFQDDGRGIDATVSSLIITVG